MLAPGELQVKLFLDIGFTAGDTWACESRCRPVEELRREWNDKQEMWVRRRGCRPEREDVGVQTGEEELRGEEELDNHAEFGQEDFEAPSS